MTEKSGKREADEAMMEARLRRLSPEARRLFEETERRVARASQDADQEAMLNDIVDRMKHLDEGDRANLSDAIGQAVHERRTRVRRSQSETDDLMQAAGLIERAAELDGVNPDSMLLERATEVLERHGEPFPASLVEKLHGMEWEEESRTIEDRRVPAFYPDLSDADTFIRWDGSAEAEAWARLQETCTATLSHAIVSAAVKLGRVGKEIGKPVDFKGLSAVLWGTSPDEVAAIIDAHREEIARLIEEEG